MLITKSRHSRAGRSHFLAKTVSLGRRIPACARIACPGEGRVDSKLPTTDLPNIIIDCKLIASCKNFDKNCSRIYLLVCIDKWYKQCKSTN